MDPLRRAGWTPLLSRMRVGAAAALLAAGLTSPALAFPDRAQGARFAPVAQAAEDRDWASALVFARQVGDPAAVVFVDWRRLSRGDGDFRQYQAFLSAYPDWPQQSRLRRLAEERMPPSVPAEQVVAFFSADAPKTGTGALALAAAQMRLGQPEAARATAARAWRELSLTPNEEQAFLAEWGGVIAPEHVARLDMLLWRGLTGEAQRMLPRVDAGHQALARARIALRRGDQGVDGLIERVPAGLVEDPGLAYERFRWRATHGLGDAAEALLMARTGSAASLGRPSAWADRRIGMVRSAQREGRARDAYIMAARHFLQPDDGYDYADLEWLAGWIALRDLNDPQAAEAHFDRFLRAVGTPISLGRGWYWLGRAREAAGDASGAREAYEQGARWQTSFYGQLAAERAGLPPDPALVGVAPPTNWQNAAALQSDQVRAGVLLHYAGDRRMSHWLLTNAAAEAKTPRDQAALGQLALELDRPEVAVRIAKAAARDGVVLPSPYYPVVELAQVSGRVSPEMALSIARQESEMNPEAVSHAGARGLMQLMPGTAKLVARRLGVAYDPSALTGDWQYNAMLGTDYLGGLVDRFGSLPLAAAGYNAGPNRVDQWMARYGDPRGGRLDMVDWIETIPFNETRNYVQRVMEGLHVYAARLNGEASAPRLTDILSR